MIVAVQLMAVGMGGSLPSPESGGRKTPDIIVTQTQELRFVLEIDFETSQLDV